MAVNLEFENKLWEMADKLRGNIQPSDYKDVILGLIFLKYISDSFEEKYNELIAEGDGFEEDRDAYVEDNVFFVPPSARWEFIKKSAKQSTIGQTKDLTVSIKKNISIDWAIRESVQAKMKMTIKRLLKKYGYPPDKTAKAVDIVMEQTKLMCQNESE